MSAIYENTAVRAAYLGSAMYIVIGSLPLFIALCGRILYPELLDVSEDPQMLLPNIVLRHGNMLIQILFFGALLSAILSTTSGAILAPATVIGENILKPRFPHWEDRQLLAAMRWAVVGVAVASAIMAFRESSIYELVAQASSVSLVSLFVPLTAGLYWNRANATGALAAIVVGMVVWIYFELFPGPVPSILYGLLASAVGMVVGSFLPQTPKAPTKV